MRCRTLLLPALLPLALLAGSSGQKSADLVKWRPLGAGETESKRSGKPVLYFLTADWCGPCRVMKADVFSDPKLAQLVNTEYVPVAVVDRRREEGKNEPEVDDVFQKFQLHGFPTLVVARPGGKDAVNATGWSSKAGTAEFLQMAKGRLIELEQARKKRGP